VVARGANHSDTETGNALKTSFYLSITYNVDRVVVLKKSDFEIHEIVYTDCLGKLRN
jgi:hypothetical protein